MDESEFVARALDECAPQISLWLHRQDFRIQAVEDILQDTLLRAWRFRYSYDPNRPFCGWLQGIAARVASDYRQQHRDIVSDPQSPLLSETPDRSNSIDGDPPSAPSAKMQQQLIQCLNKLSEQERIYVAVFYGTLTNAEARQLIQQKTGRVLASSSVRSGVRRVLQKLKKLLHEGPEGESDENHAQ